ncbi:MAG: dihydrodipicolinate reductase [Chloroflexota bacterium]
MTVRVACYGLGPIGLGIARLALARPGLAVVGAIDIDPQKIGRDLGELAGSGACGVLVRGDPEAALAEARPDVVLHATGSSLAQVAPQLLQIAAAGANVVSTCEELVFPWTAQPQLAADLDAAARRAGVTLLGAGVNPGYAMDALPLMLTAACERVRAIRVLRVVDASKRRGPLQRKIGAGLTTEEFHARVRDGSVRHVGLPESLHMIATALGWTLDSEDDLIMPVIAEREVATEHVRVPAGHVAGVRQVARGYIGEREVLTLELRMYLGAPDAQDTVEIDGDPPVRMSVAGGFHGDMATAAIVVNAIPSVRSAAPGLLSMHELPLVHCY